MPSTALKGMTDRLRDVDQLLAAHEAVTGTERGRRFDVEGLNRAAVLMLSSHFEGFLEELMAEALHAIHPSLNSPTLTGSFHNPWPDRIDDLYAFLGMEKPARKVSWQGANNASVRRNLEELVRTRNKLAHGTTGVAIYKRDVRRFRRYVEGFAQRFDDQVAAQVMSMTGSQPWPP